MKRRTLFVLLVTWLAACGTGETLQPEPTSPASPVPSATPKAIPILVPTTGTTVTATLSPPTASATTALPTTTPAPPTLILFGQIGGATRAVAVQGDYAYLNVGPRLVILDVADPTRPVVAGQSAVLPGFESLALAGDPSTDFAKHPPEGAPAEPPALPGTCVQGKCVTAGASGTGQTCAYVAAGEGGVRILDVSNPTAPVEVGFYATPGPAWSITVVGDPSADFAKHPPEGTPAEPPALPGTCVQGKCVTAGASGAGPVYAYVAAGDGLHVLDVSDPSAPVKIGFYPTPDAALDVAIVGNTAYVAEVYSETDDPRERGGLRILDLSDPAQPNEIGFYPMNPSQADEFERPNAPRGARGVAVAGDPSAGSGPVYVYLTYRTFKRGGLRVVDVSDPAHPSQVGDFQDYVYYVSDVAVAGNIAYVATGVNMGLLVLDLSDPAGPVVLADEVPGAARGVATVEDRLFIADEFGGLHIADISDPAHAVEVGFYDALGDARQVTVAGDRAYVTDGLRDLWLVEVSDPAHPVPLGAYTAPGSIEAIALAGNILYVAAETTGLQAVDVSDPRHPTLIGAYATPGLAHGVAVARGHAYVADGKLHVLDVANPAAPILVNVLEPAARVEDVVIAGDTAYLTNDRLHILDLSDVAQPVEVGLYEAPGIISDWIVAGGHIYVIVSGDLYIVNVSDPTHPIEVGFFEAPGYVSGVAVSQNYAYLVGESRLYAIDISNPATPTEIMSYDALTIGGDVAATGDYVFVADGSGGLVIFRNRSTHEP